MSPRSKREYLHAIAPRSQRATRAQKSQILHECCATCGYHRTYAIAQLNAARELDAQNTAVYSNLATAYRRKGSTEQAEEMLRILAQLNAQEVERIRSAPGDRKAGYAERTRPPGEKPPPQH